MGRFMGIPQISSEWIESYYYYSAMAGICKRIAGKVSFCPGRREKNTPPVRAQKAPASSPNQVTSRSTQAP